MKFYHPQRLILGAFVPLIVILFPGYHYQRLLPVGVGSMAPTPTCFPFFPLHSSHLCTQLVGPRTASLLASQLLLAWNP